MANASFGFVESYFINPITQHSGYNPVNSVAYALVAMGLLYLLFRLLQKWGVVIDWRFFTSIFPFVLFGTTVRAITDSINEGIITSHFGGLAGPLYPWVAASKIYDYGFLTVSPGIYLLTASLFLLSFLICRKLGRPNGLPYLGIALWLPNFAILAGMFTNFGFALLALALAAAPVLAIYYLRPALRKDSLALLPLAAQSLDGAATFVMVDIFGKAAGMNFGAIALLPKAIGILSGSYLPFFGLKVLLALAAIHLLSTEKGIAAQERSYLYIVLALAGFAPGLHDLFHLLIAH